MTDIINTLIRCEFAYMLNLASSAITKLYYAMLLIANCVSKVDHFQLALVVRSKTKSTDIFNALLG